MPITVKHSKTSAIPDAGDANLVQPSDWNADHTLTGLGTMAEQNANAVAITGGTISGVTIPASNVTGTLGVANGGTGATTLTGYVKGAGTTALTASSTIPNTDITGLGTASTKDAGAALGVATLDAGGKVPVSELPAAVLGALSYQGTWDASTNTPTLTSSSGVKGYYYVVSVAGNTNLDGITDWLVGDWAVYNGTVWQKVDNTETVTSVNGQVGAVVLTTTNIAEGTNEYFTQVRARTSISAGTGISYDNTTGVITNSSPSLGGDVVGPASATDNAVARYNLTTGKLIQNSVTLIDDTGNASGILSQQFSDGTAVSLAAGKIWYNGTTGSWNAGMGGGNVTQQIGEELFVYGKASATITDSPLQIIYQTGATGASGVIQFAPTISGITDGTLVIGVATENIANNGFGRITSYGVVRGITTNGTAFGETWADGDEIYYNPVTGNPTNIKPVAPNVKVSIGTLIHAGAGGSGSIQVEINHGSVLGGTDANVQITSVSNGQILSYDGGNGYWKNTDLTAGTGISVSESVNGVLTIANTSPSSGGTVTSVGGTGTVNGITLTGTVTTSGNLTLGGTLSGVSLTTQVSGTLPFANGGTGETTRQAAMDALAGAVTSGQFLRGNGTDVVMAAIQSADVPTLNQNTTGSAGSVANALTAGTGLTSTATYNGSAAITFNATGTTINSQTSGYTLVATDAGKTISITTGGVTIPNAVMAAGNIVSIYNNSGSSQTITQGASLTLQFAGQSTSTTGNRTLGLYGLCTIVFISSSNAVITGSGIT